MSDFNPAAYGDVEDATSAPESFNPEKYGEPVNWNDILHQQATANLVHAQDINPDQAAKAVAVSKQLNLPQPAVAADLPIYSKIADTAINRQNILNNPKLQAWLAANPANAQVASDDIPNLTFLERVMQSLDIGAETAINQNQIGRLGNELEAKNIAGVDTSSTMAEINRRSASEQERPQLSGGFKLARDFTSLIVGQLDSVLSALPEAAAGAAIGATAGAATGAAIGAPAAGVGAAPGAAVGAAGGATSGALRGLVVGWKLDQSRVAAGQAYIQMNNIVGKDGQQLSEASKLLGSAMVGASTYALFSIGGGAAKGAAGDVLAKMSTDAALQAVTRPTIQLALKDAAITTVKGGLGFMAFNSAMTLINQISVEAAKVFSSGEFENIANSPELRDQYVSELANSMEDGLKFGLVLGGFGASMGLHGDYVRAREAQQNAAALTDLMNGAEKSKLRSRSAEMFSDFMRSQTKGKPAENVFIPAEKVQALYQEYGISPGEQDPLFGFVHNIKEQLTEATRTNGDVVIPTADFVTHLAGSEVGKKLIPDVRMTADGLSLNEAKQFQAQAAELQKQLNFAPKEEDSGRKVYDDVLQKAQNAGYSESDAKVYASLYAARYTARAERKGTSAFEEYNRVPLEIKTEVPPVGKLPSLHLDRRATKRGEATPGYYSMEDLASFYGTKPPVPGMVNKSALEEGHRGTTVEEMVKEAKEHIANLEKPQQLFQFADDAERNAYFDHLDGADLPISEEGIKNLEHYPGAPSWHQLVQETQARDALYNRALYIAKEQGRTSIANMARNLGVPYIRAERIVKQLEEEGYIKQAERQEGARVTVEGEKFKYTKEEVKHIYGPGQYETTDKINAANILAQSEGPQRRASIEFGQNQNLINLFKDANMSSLGHESGHLWLKELSEDAGLPDAPKDIVTDFDTFLKWSGFSGDREAWNKASFEEQRPYHEKFAKAFEQYLMEGKAPTSALRQVFAKFRDWLTKIYVSLDRLGAPINEEIRGVFDRLIATDARVQNAKYTVGDRSVFEMTGMGKTEAAAYAKAIEQATAEAHDRLMAKELADVKKRYSAEYREKRAEVSDAVADEVDNRPEMKAYRFLKFGDGKNSGLPGMEAFKLNEEASQRIAWGERDPEMPVVKQLPKGILAKDGVMPDEAAEILGFKSGSDLVKAMQRLEVERQIKMMENGSRDSIRQVQIDNEVDRRMNEQFPQPSPAEMEQEALDAVHNKERDHALAIEARVMARMAGKAQIDVEDIRGWARDSIAQKTVSDATDVNAYARGEHKAANLAQKALLAGNYDEALKYKRQQILNNELYKEAAKARDEVNSAQKLFTRLTNKPSFKGIDQEYTDQIQDLLRKFGFDSGRGEELQRTKGGTLEDFVNRKYMESGLELAVDPALYTLQGKDFKSMSMPEFRALDDAVRSMYQLGRDEKLITVGDQKVQFDSVVEQMVTAIRALGEREKNGFYDPTDAGRWAAFKEKTFGALKSVDASLLKPEALFDQIDRGDPFGIMNEAVFRRMKDAQHNEDVWHQKSADGIKALVKTMPKGWDKTLREVIPEDARLINPETGTPMRLTRQRMIAIALNWGNEGNRKKLADGYGWMPADVKSFLDRNMSKEEWNFVQNIWNMFSEHTEALDALQKRVTGVGLKLVQADAFDTPHGHMEGGYYPIVYDANKSERAASLQEKNTQALFPGNYTRATTPKGNTIARVEGVKRPIELSLDIAPWKIGQTLHDLAFREAIMDADRLLSNKDVRSAMKDVFGKEYANLMRPWLKYVANSKNIDDAAIGWMDKAVDAARANTVIVGIGFRATTLFKHTMTALSNSIGELGPKWMLAGTREFYGPGMSEKWDFIKQKSPEMAFRLSSYDKDLMKQYDHLLKDSTYTTFQKNAQYFGHIAISYLDLGSAVPTWLGAYRKALSEGMEDKDAVYFADKTVRNAHGAQGITDRSAIQHASGVARLTNMFYGFFNHIYNRQRTMFIQGKEGIQNIKSGQFRAAGKDFAGVLGKSFYYIVVPALVEAMATNHGPDENKDEGWGEWAGKAILAEIPAGIPILRDVAKAAIEGRGYEMSPIAKLVDTVVQSSRDVEKMMEGEEAPKAGEHASAAAGYIFGLPTAAPFTAGKFLWDYSNGDVDPQSVSEWINGLTKGKTE